MANHLRKDVDFNGLFRKLGHPLEEIRIRALENIQSKLDHKLICYADIINEKQLYIRLLEWFNITGCSHKAEVLALLNRLSQHTSGAQQLQDVGGIEFLSQLRSDIEPSHRPVIDQILENIMMIPDSGTEEHAPECIYHKATDSAIWGASQVSDSTGLTVTTSIDKLNLLDRPGYFTTHPAQASSMPVHQVEAVSKNYTLGSTDIWIQSRPQDGSLFRLSTFPWLPLTQTDRQVIESTKSTLLTKDPKMLTGACEFLADVVFQDFPAELFLQRPEILKNLLSITSLPDPVDFPVVIQACKTLTCYLKFLQVRTRSFQDPLMVTVKHELTTSSTEPSSLSSSTSSRGAVSQQRNYFDWSDRRHRGDGQDVDSLVTGSRSSSVNTEVDDELDLEDEPSLLQHQLTVPQFCISILQRVLPRLHTSSESLGVSVLELTNETLYVLLPTLDKEIWIDNRTSARDVVDRLIDCLDIFTDLLAYHHHYQHSVTSKETSLGSLSTHRILYMGLVNTLANFLNMIPKDKLKHILPEKLKLSLPSIVYDEALTFANPRYRAVILAVAQLLGLSLPVDFQQVQNICLSLTKTCQFCLQIDTGNLTAAELSSLAEESIPSIIYHLHLPFVSKFVNFVSKICTSKTADKAVVNQCNGVLLQLMSHPVDSVRQVCYVSIVDVIKRNLQVSQAADPKSQTYLLTKFLINSDVLYEMTCFGLADSVNKVRNCSADSLNHLLQSQLLMSEGLWQEFLLALMKCLPVLQSYTDHTTPLGRSLWYILDPTTTTHNLPLFEKLRGSLRLLYLSDKKLRLDAAKHLRWFLKNEKMAENKLPDNLEVDKMSSCLILSSPQFVEDDTTRSVFKEDGLKQVYNIFISKPVDPGVKKSAADQMAIMLKDPYLHATFKASGGVEVICSVIQQSVLKQDGDSKAQDDVSACLPPCLSILRNITHYDYTLRHTLAKDQPLYYALIRVCLIHHMNESVRTDVSHILTLLLFDEVSKFDVGFGLSNAPGTKFSLPAQVIQRYRLPFKFQAHHLTSPSAITLPDPSKDIMTTSGPKEMMKIAWNCAWQGGIDPLLDSFKTPFFSETNKEFSDLLVLTSVEQQVLKMSHVTWYLKGTILSIQQAADHITVMTAVHRMMSYTTAFKIPSVCQFFTTQEWYLVLNKFMTTTPTCYSDLSLLLHILQFVSSVLHCLSSSPAVTCSTLNWLIDKMYQPDGPLISLLNKPGTTSEPETLNIKRQLNKEILHFVTKINLTLPYQLSQRANSVQMRGEVVRTLQQGFNIGDAPHFYNLASLESALICLMHVTSRPGWSCECSSVDSLSFCNQLLNSLLEVVWSFHVGRGGTSRSFMGKGVTKSCALCLRHLAYEMIRNADDPDWVKSWLYLRQDPNTATDHGLNWLLTLWAYRDSEVRAAGLGIAVALTSTQPGRLLVTANCRHIPGGIWGAAFSILLDSLECCIVQQQAALLLVNLTSQAMPSGDVETLPGTWQGPVVIDPDCQVMLIGLNALEALLDHTKFYAAVSDMLATFCSASAVQLLLTSTDVTQSLESSSNLTDSSSVTSVERTARTALTTVSSLSSGFTTPNLTPRSKTTLDRSKSPTNENPFTSSTSTTQVSDEGDRNESYQQSMSSTSQNLTTPSLLSAVVRLMKNLVILNPQSCIEKIRSKAILTSLINLVKPSTIQTLCDEMANGQLRSASALTLIDLLQMYESITDLLTTSVILDTRSRLDLVKNKAGLRSLASLIVLQWQDKDDVAKAFASVSFSVLNLLSSLLQKHEANILTTFLQVLGPLWIPLIDSLCSMLDDRSSDRFSLQLASLDFLTLLCCEEILSLQKNPERVMDVATLSELLDTPLADDSQENVKEIKTTGRQISKNLVSLFESAIKISLDDKGTREANRKLKVIAAFKSLLTVSHTSKEFALEAGLVEITINYLKHTHALLNLETLDMIKVGGKKEGPFLQEMVLMFDFIRNFMFNNSSVKVASYHSGLTVVIQKLWAWCQQEPSLLSSVLLLLSTYSAHCNSAAGSLASPISAMSSTKPSGQLTILHGVLKLAQKELDRDECSPVLRLTFLLLTNSVMNSDCRNILMKSSFINQFSQLNPRKKRGKFKIAVDMLWCDLLTALSFSIDGQLIILKIPDVLTVLLDLIEAGSTHCQHRCILIIRNLCCHSPNKPKLLAVDKLVQVVMDQAESKTDKKKQLIAISALWALIFNSHKARVQVKSANVLPRMVNLLHDLQASGFKSRNTSSKCDMLRTIISALRE